MRLEFYVEEPSAEAFLIEIVPKILTEHPYEYEIFPFEGKQALLRKLPNRLKAYPHLPGDDWRVVVLVDQDDEDCRELKATMERMALDARLTTRTAAKHPQHFQVLNRIVITELEAWLFGDVEALHAAYPRISLSLGEQAGYRDPDAVADAWEKLERLLKDTGDHPGGLEKIRAASEIARHMQPMRNRSKSFQVFRDALLDLFAAL